MVKQGTYSHKGLGDAMHFLLGAFWAAGPSENVPLSRIAALPTILWRAPAGGTPGKD